jgi:multidrug efflux pump
MNISRFFIDRPIFAGVLSALFLLAGIVGLLKLPVSEYPPVVPPSVVVHAQYPGATPKVMAETVAAPLEEQINGVENMLYMQSLSSNDGHLYLTVTFRLGTDPDKAQQFVENRVSQALPRLPEDVQRLGVATVKSSPTITLAVNIISTNHRYDINYLSNFAILRVKDQLARIQGVGDVKLWGPGGYAMRVWLDPEKIAARGMSANDVITAIRQQNIQAAAGVVGGPPSADAPLQLSINAKGRLQTPDEFGAIVVRSSPDGSITLLRDVARIELAAENYGMRGLLNNEQVLSLAIMEAPGANALQISDDVEATMKELKKSFPEGIDYIMPYNPTRSIRAGIEAVIHTLFEAIALVVLVVFLFLQTWRASIIPLLAVPVSIVGTAAALLMLGFSINALSLFGLVLAIGIVVDDAIVVVENVERNIVRGLAPLQATYRAMREVSAPIVAIALVLVSVFLPLAFMGGLTGQFYKQFAVTISISTVISAFNSLTLSPALAALLLKPHGEGNDWLTRGMHKVFGRFFAAFNRVFDRSADSYGRGVAGLARRKATVGIVYALLLGATVMFSHLVPGGFIPSQDKEFVVGVAQLQNGASLDRTEEITRQITDIVRQNPAVENIFTYPGLSVNATTNSSSSALLHILLKPYKQRHDPSMAADAVVADLNVKLKAVRGAYVAIFGAPPIQGLGSLGGFKLQIEDRGSHGYDALYNATQAFIKAAQKAPELGPLFSTYSVNTPQLEVEVDRVKAAQLGVLVTDVFDTLQVYMGSLYVNDFNSFGRVYQVRAQADAQYRAKPADILALKTRSNNGKMIPLGSLLTIHETYGADLLTRYNGFTAADINGGPAPGYSSDQAQAAIERIAAETLPKGFTFEWTDLTYQQIIAGNSGPIVLALGVLLVFLVLAAQYESLLLPIAILLIVPMAILSALAGVWMMGADNNIFTQIGLIVLVGLASKNAILIVEFARELEFAGRTPVQAAMEASRLRLRPILMTSIAFIAGVVPLIVSSGAGAEMRHAMGVAVFFGMLGVTVFGLAMTPVFYVALRALSGNRKLTYHGSIDAEDVESPALSPIHAPALEPHH